MSRLMYAAIICIAFIGCHVYEKGFIVNKTSSAVYITTRPSLLSYKKDLAYQRIVDLNLSETDSAFNCYLLPKDSLIFNSGPSYSSALNNINYLKININYKDSIVMNSQKKIHKSLNHIHKSLNRITIGFILTDSFINALKESFKD